MGTIVLKDVTVAYVMIKTEKGTALSVAAAVSALSWVDRVLVVTGPWDLKAVVMVADNQALGDLVDSEIRTIEEVLDTDTMVMSSCYQGGQLMGTIDNGPP